MGIVPRQNGCASYFPESPMEQRSRCWVSCNRHLTSHHQSTVMVVPLCTVVLNDTGMRGTSGWRRKLRERGGSFSSFPSVRNAQFLAARERVVDTGQHGILGKISNHWGA